jgi:hypothetical protein
MVLFGCIAWAIQERNWRKMSSDADSLRDRFRVGTNKLDAANDQLVCGDGHRSGSCVLKEQRHVSHAKSIQLFDTEQIGAKFGRAARIVSK